MLEGRAEGEEAGVVVSYYMWCRVAPVVCFGEVCVECGEDFGLAAERSVEVIAGLWGCGGKWCGAGGDAEARAVEEIDAEAGGEGVGEGEPVSMGPGGAVDED